MNGQHFCDFPHRMAAHRVTHLAVDGDVSIALINHEMLPSQPASAPPMQGPPQGVPQGPPQGPPMYQGPPQGPPPQGQYGPGGYGPPPPPGVNNLYSPKI